MAFFRFFISLTVCFLFQTSAFSDSFDDKIDEALNSIEKIYFTNLTYKSPLHEKRLPFLALTPKEYNSRNSEIKKNAIENRASKLCHVLGYGEPFAYEIRNGYTDWDEQYDEEIIGYVYTIDENDFIKPLSYILSIANRYWYTFSELGCTKLEHNNETYYYNSKLDRKINKFKKKSGHIYYNNVKYKGISFLAHKDGEKTPYHKAATNKAIQLCAFLGHTGPISFTTRYNFALSRDDEHEYYYFDESGFLRKENSAWNGHSLFEMLACKTSNAN